MRDQIDSILKLSCADKIDKCETEKMLEEYQIPKKEYNTYILELLEHKNNTLKLESYKDINLMKSFRDEDRNRFIGKNMQTFFRLDFKPSYLFTRSILENEDYEYLLNIFENFYNTKLGDNALIIKKLMDEYIESMIESCEDDYSTENLLKCYYNKW